MMDSCEEDLYPSSLNGWFEDKKVGAICKGGVHLGSAYFHSSLGIKHAKNMGLLQDIARVVRTLKGPFVISADFNATPEELASTGWLELIGGVNDCT